MSHAHKYTQEELDIALLKNTNESIFRAPSDLEKQMTESKSEVKSEFVRMRSEIAEFKAEFKADCSMMRADIKELRADMKSQLHLIIGLVLGIYGLIAAAALGKLIGIL